MPQCCAEFCYYGAVEGSLSYNTNRISQYIFFSFLIQVGKHNAAFEPIIDALENIKYKGKNRKENFPYKSLIEYTNNHRPYVFRTISKTVSVAVLKDVFFGNNCCRRNLAKNLITNGRTEQY